MHPRYVVYSKKLKRKRLAGLSVAWSGGFGIVEVWSPKWPGTNQYRLHSFVNHVGASAATGHYVAFARGDEGWQEFDDSRVRAISSFSQLPPNAHTGGYLFFYVRE